MDTYELIHYIWAVALAVGPILGYIPQYIDIRKTKDHRGFSSVICFILLTANILRILSYFLHPFDVALLVQSIFMIIVQLLILHLIVKLAARDILPTPHSHVQFNVSSTSEIMIKSTTIALTSPSSNSSERHFIATFWSWQWFISYVIFLFSFTLFFASIAIVERFWLPSPFIQAAFLYLSTLVESTLCMPQLWTNYKNKSTSGLNNSLVVTWVCGDAFKLGYYVYTHSAWAFIICAVIQICVDVLIIGQIYWYNRSSHHRSVVTSRAPSTVPFKNSTDSLISASIR